MQAMKLQFLFAQFGASNGQTEIPQTQASPNAHQRDAPVHQSQPQTIPSQSQMPTPVATSAPRPPVSIPSQSQMPKDVAAAAAQQCP
eukprot:4874117-Pyramimonas_sp.AAC.1